MKVLVFLAIVGAWYPLCAGNAGERTAVVCLSMSDHVTFTLAFPETCKSKKLVIVDHVGREVLQWILPCIRDVHPAYKDRIVLTCDLAAYQLQLTLLRLTEADSGQLQCRDGGLHGPALPDCHLELDVIGVEDLSQVCSYFAGNRTVVCERVTQEVKIYRIGKKSNKDISNFSRPFHYIMKSRQYGRYSVTRTSESRESKQCSQDFTFDVARPTGDAALEISGKNLMIAVGVMLSVFSILFIACIDNIMNARIAEDEDRRRE